MKKVNDWIYNDESRKLEEQVQYAIASEGYEYLNGCLDCPEDYKPMSREDWIEYIRYGLELREGMTINGVEHKHNRFYGKENTMKLIKKWVDECDDVKPYVI